MPHAVLARAALRWTRSDGGARLPMAPRHPPRSAKQPALEHRQVCDQCSCADCRCDRMGALWRHRRPGARRRGARAPRGSREHGGGVRHRAHGAREARARRAQRSRRSASADFARDDAVSAIARLGFTCRGRPTTPPAAQPSAPCASERSVRLCGRCSVLPSGRALRSPLAYRRSPIAAAYRRRRSPLANGATPARARPRAVP